MAARTTMIKVRVSSGEHRVLLERARECGQGTSTYMREVALGSVPRARPRRIEQQAVNQLARIGNNLNQLARAANTSRQVELTQRLGEVLAEVEAAVRRLA
ncbi:MAG: MobC family plasmid mobilization relaxosome protein [bacterium]|nr:MobC family plasmid mobilization relaxosome protein [bacterium]